MTNGSYEQFNKYKFPKFLYKYQSCSSQSIQNLKQKMLWFSKIEKFNDPFEFRILFEEIVNDLGRQFFERFHCNLLKYGIACFSEIHNDILMWSHYGDSHKGLCLKFDTSFEPFKKVPIKVIYKTEAFTIENIKLGQSGYAMEALLAMVSTKAKHWEYEKEWRLVVPDGDRGISYEQDSLDSIYLGALIQNTQKDVILKILENTKTKVFSMELDRKEYKVNPIQVK